MGESSGVEMPGRELSGRGSVQSVMSVQDMRARVCLSVCLCMCAFVSACVCARTRACVCVCVRACVCEYVCMCVSLSVS